MGQNECNTTQQLYRGRRTYPMTKNSVALQGKTSSCNSTSPCHMESPCNEIQKPQPLSSTSNICNKNCTQLKCLIDQISFAMDDTRLYLDTHPDCQEALAYYKKMKKMRNEALAEYQKHCGAIVSYEAGEDDCETWNWVNAPLPWENMSCNGRRM